MNKGLLFLFSFCVLMSCKPSVGANTGQQCELFKIGKYEFYNPKVYDYPIITKKGSHELLNSSFIPVWYAGYAAKNLPSFFKSKKHYLEYVNASKIKKYSKAYFESFYDKYKTDLKGIDALNHKNFHLLFRGTVNVQDVNSGEEYLLVAGKSYLDSESDFDKNTEFYESGVKTMFAFKLENNVYKSVEIDHILGQFEKVEYDRVYNILNVKNMINLTCLTSINTTNKANFSETELPKWVYNKFELSK